MASEIWEFFGYRANDKTSAARDFSDRNICPITKSLCEKTFNDGVVSGVCSIKPMTSPPVICCPNRLYSENYRFLKDIALLVFESDAELKPGKEALKYVADTGKDCIAVFGKRWGGELRLPQKSGVGGYFVDWVLAKLGAGGDLVEFVAVEVQTIDTTGNYRNGFEELRQSRNIVKTTAGLNWENVSKRILPQLIYKGQVLQREHLCRKGLFFVCPTPVYEHVVQRLGGEAALVKYALQPASITFLVYDYDNKASAAEGEIYPVRQMLRHTTTVYKVQEAFNNVTLPDENVYEVAIRKALSG